MANEIFGSELNVDFSGILQQAEAFDEKLKDIDHTAKQLGNTLRNALGNIDLGGIKSLKDNIERLGESKISLKVVGTEELGKMSSALDVIISQVDVFSKKANKQTVAPKTSALFDLEELQAKRDRAVAIIKDLEGQVRALNTQYQAALTERGAVRDSIGGISKDEISELQQQINELGQAMQQVGAGSGQNWRQSIQPYIDAINQLKDKIAQIKEEEDSLFQTEGAKPNSRVAQLDAQYDGLYKTINGLLDEVDQIDSEMQDKIASNKAVEEQIKKIEEWKAKIKELEDDFTRLNAAGKAFGSDGKLTSEGADLTNRKAQLEEELKLMQMNASEAKRYSDSIIAQEQREADLAIQEEQRTTNAKIAEYNRLVSEEARLRKEAREQRKAIDNENLDPIGKSQAQTALDATVEEQQRVADRMVEIERELGDELNSIKQKALAAQLREVIRNNDEMLREQERAAREQERIEKENKKLEQEAEKAHYTENPQAAIDFSKSTQSINEQIKALQYLKAARDNLTVSAAGGESAYKQKIEELNEAIKETQDNIDELKGKQEELRNNQSKLLNTTDQLQRKLALLFSVSAVKGYIDKLVAVRGEFEMQTRSLEILLQNKKEANALWNQTVDLAVKSPFRVQELVKYTKQLAAYRIENDKLFETNKMLADVSAGLGVDMQRLILAFGQVKAANFLRGTELRQFSEAGVNMLDELANILTEVEGRMISVGDVFEMISNRQISFEHVEEVFKRITSPGGLFYQMQEKQSETTKGMMLNLHDSIELMMNDIGISYDGVIKGGIEALKTLVDNWQTIAPIVKTIVYSFGFNLIRKGILSLVSLFSTAGTAVAGFFKTFKIAMLGAQMQMATGTSAARAYLGTLRSLSTISFSGWLSIITIIGMVGTAIYQVVSATDKLSEELNRIDQDLSKQLTDNIALYKELADKVNDVTASEYDRNLALDEMKRAFKDILPDEMLRAETIASYGDNYEKAEKAMRSYYNSEKLMQQTSKIEAATDDEIKDYIEKVEKNFLIGISTHGFQHSNLAPKTEMIRQSYLRILNDIIKDVRNGKIDVKTKDLNEEFYSRLFKFVEINEDEWSKAVDSDSRIKSYLVRTKTAIQDIQEELVKEQEKVGNIQPLLGATWDEEQMEKQAAQIQQQVTIVQNAYKTIADLASQYASGKVTNWDDILPNINKALQDVQTNAPAYYDALNTVWENLKANAEEGTFKFNAELQRLGDGFNEAIADVIAKTHEGNDAAINFSEGLREALDDQQLSQQGEAIVQIFENVASSMELDPNIFAKFVPTAQQSLSDIRNMLEGEIAALQDQVRRMNTAMKSGVGSFIFSMLFSLKEGESPEQRIAKLNKLISAYNLALNRLGGPKKAPSTKRTRTPKTKKSKSNKTKNSDDPAENLYDFLGEIYDAFQDFNKEMSAEASNAKIAEIYGKEFEKLEGKVKGLDLKLPEFKQGDEKPYLDALDAVLKEAPQKTQEKIKKEKQKAEKEQEVEDAKELNDETERYIDFLFEQHELYKELKKLGVSEKHAKALFGLDVASLKDINKELERLKKQGKLAGTRMAEVELEAQGKIAEEERSIQEERLKTYIEYANKAVSERAKIELEYLNEMAEIEEATLIRPEDSEEAIMYKNTIREENTKKALKEYQEGLQKLEWDEFQKSDTFIMMFEDLEFASEKLIRSTLEDLRNFKGEWANMPLEDMRAMISKINELEGSLLKLQNPFKVTKKLKNELKGLYLPDLQMEAKEFESEIKENDNIIAQLEIIRDLRKRGIELSDYQADLLWNVGLAENSVVSAINGMIDARQEANSKAKSALGITLDQINKFKELKKSYDAQKAVIETITEKAREVYDAFSELFKLFADEDSIGFAFAEMGMSMAESVAQAMVLQLQVKQTEIAMMSAGIEADSFAMKLNQAMGVVGWIVMGVQVLSQVLGAIFGAKDKKLQKEIDKLDEDIEKLSKALEKLEDALEKNYAFESLRSDMQEINSNIDQQIAKRRRQIYLEKKKKETDKDQIKDWEDEIEELEEERAEAHREMIESLGGVDDYRSATREFVDAWVEAFNETGNGLQGLTENFREFFKNIILEQAVMKGAGKIMEPLLDEINMSLGDYEIQGHEEQKIKALSEQKMKELDEFLNGLFGDNGMWNEWIDDKGQSLSGLQEGIQGVTEETAQIIEAYLNSIRFYIAQDNQNLADLRNFFIGSEKDTNPILSQLKMQTELIRAIKDMFSSVIYSGGHPTYGGAFLKVSL